MLANGVRVVATSNRPPSELYKGGLNRPLFEPFVDMLHERFEVVDLSSNHDYRLIGAAGPMKVYLLESPEHTADAGFGLRAEFRRLVSATRCHVQTLYVHTLVILTGLSVFRLIFLDSRTTSGQS